MNVFLVLLVALHLPTIVLCWGPFTHQYFASQDEAHGTSSPFRTGGSAPDAVKKLENSLHTFPFASTLYKTATTNGNMDDIEFSLGYGCHLAHDFVGHHTKGFLNPQEDHPIELAADTYIHDTIDKSSFGEITTAMVDLISKASAAASVDYPFIKAVTSTQVQGSVGKFKTLTTAEAVALELNRWTYKKQLVKDSYCNITDFNGAVNNFNRALNWSVLACNFWRETMTKKYVNGTEAETMVENYVDELFTSHNGTSC